MRVKLIDYMGGDLTVVNAARVSFHKVSEELGPRDEKLIQYLATHKHWTPFAHPQITFLVEAPVFVRTQCFKHKVGLVENEVSRRYVNDEPKFYKPGIWRGKPENAKQGSTGEAEYQEEIDKEVSWHYAEAKQLYLSLIAHDVAPEQARMVLPQAMYTEWWWTGSLYAFANFYNLRTDPHAQVETSYIAKQIGDILEKIYPVSWRVLCT